MSEKKNERLKNLDKEILWHPFTQMKEYASEENLLIEKGEGNYLIDSEGNRYLDGTASLWVNVHGHRKKEIDEALKAQIDKIAHTTLLGIASAPSIELAEKLIQIAPRGESQESTLNHVFYSDNGSTAVEVALKIAFEYWQLKGRSTKQKFVSFLDAYHGDTLGAVSVGHIELFHEIYRPLLFKTFQAPSPQNLDCLVWLENLFKEKSEEIAACIIEPLLQAAGGMIVQPVGFLKKLEKLCRKYEILLIADEVATGFGRTGKMFACEQEQVVPDLLCIAKGLTAGYLPLAATLTSSEIYQAFLGDYSQFKAFFHGHSYTGNALGCAVALANLEIFENEKVLEKLPEKIRAMKESLQSLNSNSHVKEIRQCGLMAGIELVRDKQKGDAYPSEERIGHQVILAARRRGIILRPLGSVIVLFPPLSINLEEIKTMVQVLKESIEEVCGA